jgi:hypothetical protein
MSATMTAIVIDWDPFLAALAYALGGITGLLMVLQ